MARKKIHPWLAERGTAEAAVVLRIDGYNEIGLARGQFVPLVPRMDDANKAIWPSVEKATAAAEWAARKFGHQYAVFKMVTIVERTSPPIEKTEV